MKLVRDHCHGHGPLALKHLQESLVEERAKMDYYRPNMSGGGGGGVMPSQTYVDTSAAIMNSASDSYAPDYWAIPYTDGLSPMKQIEGRFFVATFFFFLTKRVLAHE